MPRKGTSGPAESAVREGSIVRAILREAKRHEPGLALAKRHGTVFGRAGEPDIYGCLNGRHLEVEIKRPGEEPGLLQRERLRRWAAAGAITGVAHSVEEFFRVLDGAGHANHVREVSRRGD